MPVGLTVDGRSVELPDGEMTLLEALRERLGITSVKDGCSPQGQCGCCTVLVDGVARVSCVTPLRRVAGRSVTTFDGLAPARRAQLVEAFVRGGGSQCGFCTPGIICRLSTLPESPDPSAVQRALLAHLCRCTGWQPIVEGALNALSPAFDRSFAAAARRATLEGGTPQQVGPEVVEGRAGFAADTAPPDALVAVPDGRGGWAVGETLASARAAAAEIPGRRSGGALVYPVDLPPGDWDVTLQTTWVEPAYLETDASWCRPGEAPVSPLANGGAFGGKLSSVAPRAAAQLSAKYGRPVLVLLSRPDTVRMGAKRPPIGAGLSSSGHGVLRIASTPGVEAVIAAVAPHVSVELVEVTGPATSLALRGAGWAEAAVLLAAIAATPAATPSGTSATASIRSPSGASATATVGVDSTGLPTYVAVQLDAGDPLDEVVLRSYVTGAAHMALGWVCSEGIAVGEDGVPDDLTIRSFGVLRARDTPPINIELAGGGEPVEGSGAVFAAVAAACWSAQGLPPRWPTLRGRFS